MTTPGELTISEARKLQLKIADKAVFKDSLPARPRRIGGVDAAYAVGKAFVGLAVLDYQTLDEIEVKTATVKETFPYIPTLLSFREAPAVSEVLKRIEVRPDALIVDGHGAAHPNRCGLATYVGVTEGIPTIGVAKGLLWGKIGVFDSDGRALITYNDEVIGVALNTSTGKPIYVSVGSNISLKRGVEIVQHCTRRHILPEPLVRAHLAANRARAAFVGGRNI